MNTEVHRDTAIKNLSAVITPGRASTSSCDTKTNSAPAAGWSFTISAKAKAEPEAYEESDLRPLLSYDHAHGLFFAGPNGAMFNRGEHAS